jgi:ectoine hydroxylase-related dioxygenase (phytanoyl-CoA dioxygenase family)
MDGRRPHQLTEEEIAAYRRDGLVVPELRISDSLLDRMRESLERLLRDNPHVSPDAMYCPHRPYSAEQGLRGSAAWIEYARSPELLDVVEDLIGPDIILWGSTLFGKPADIGKEVPWHQDGEYWPIDPLATCTVWVALDDSTPDNGCLRYVVGSHREKRMRSHIITDRQELAFNQMLDPAELEGVDVALVPLAAGQLSCHDVFTVHGSGANRTGKRRAGFALRYMPSTSRFDHSCAVLGQRGSKVSFSDRQIFLMRGQDRCGQNNFAIGG